MPVSNRSFMGQSSRRRSSAEFGRGDLTDEEEAEAGSAFRSGREVEPASSLLGFIGKGRLAPQRAMSAVGRVITSMDRSSVVVADQG